MKVMSFLKIPKVTHFFIFELDENNVTKIKATQNDFYKVSIFTLAF